MLGHKISLNTFQKIKILQNMFSGHSRIKPEINNKKDLENSQVFGN